MQSGSPIPTGDISHGQKYYDALVSQTGCSGASDTLECLRQLPFNTLKAAVDASPGLFAYQVRRSEMTSRMMLIRFIQSLSLAWLPRADGVFLKNGPQLLVSQGTVSNIPFVTGVCGYSILSFGYLTDRRA